MVSLAGAPMQPGMRQPPVLKTQFAPGYEALQRKIDHSRRWRGSNPPPRATDLRQRSKLSGECTRPARNGVNASQGYRTVKLDFVLSMILSENRFPPCASAALRVRIVLSRSRCG